MALRDRIPTEKDLILINGKSYDWNDVSIVIGSQVLFGVTKLGYAYNHDIQPISNANMFALGYGIGKVNVGGELEIDRDELQILRFAANEFNLQNLPLFDILVYLQGFERGENSSQLDVIKNCKIINTDNLYEQNDPNLKVTLTFIASHINTDRGGDIIDKAEGVIQTVKDILTERINL